jgi:hypothetical protein
LLVEYVFVEFVACTTGYLVIDQCTVVSVLLLVANSKSVDVCFGSFPFEAYLDAVACEAVRECNVAVPESAVLFLTYEQLTKTCVAA